MAAALGEDLSALLSENAASASGAAASGAEGPSAVSFKEVQKDVLHLCVDLFASYPKVESSGDFFVRWLVCELFA
jgi:hypothetical protein